MFGALTQVPLIKKESSLNIKYQKYSLTVAGPYISPYCLKEFLSHFFSNYRTKVLLGLQRFTLIVRGGGAREAFC